MEKLYHIWVLRKDGSYERQTSYPMTHRECMVMKSKMLRQTQSAAMCYGFDELPPNTVDEAPANPPRTWLPVGVRPSPA